MVEVAKNSKEGWNAEAAKNVEEASVEAANVEAANVKAARSAGNVASAEKVSKAEMVMAKKA